MKYKRLVFFAGDPVTDAIKATLLSVRPRRRIYHTPSDKGP